MPKRHFAEGNFTRTEISPMGSLLDGLHADKIFAQMDNLSKMDMLLRVARNKISPEEHANIFMPMNIDCIINLLL